MAPSTVSEGSGLEDDVAVSALRLQSLSADSGPAARWMVFSMAGLYIAFFCGLAWVRYRCFAFYDFDLANYSQMCWGICRGSLRSSVLGVNFLGNHVNLILFPVALLYGAFPTPMTLLWLQTALIGLSVIPLWGLARREMGKGFALGLAGAYLLYPALIRVNLYEFHPVSLSIFFLGWCIYCYYGRRFAPYAIFLSLALICQEDMALPALSLGVLALVQRRSRRWVLVPLAAGTGWLFLCEGMIKPGLGNVLVGHMNLYRHLGNGYLGIARNALLHPWMLVRFVCTPATADLLARLVLPLGALPLFAPGVLALSIPVLAQHLLSIRFTEHTILYHYTAPLIPFIFAAAVFGARRVATAGGGIVTPALMGRMLPALAIAANAAIGPLFMIPRNTLPLFRDGTASLKQEFVAAVPPERAVIATFGFLPHLANRTGLYSFHNLYAGVYTMSGLPFAPPAEAAMMLVDCADPVTFTDFREPQGPSNVRRFLDAEGWGVKRAAGNIVLWERGYRGGERLFEDAAENVPSRGLKGVAAGGIEFLGFDLPGAAVRRGGCVTLVTYWRALAAHARSLGIVCTLADGSGKAAVVLAHPLGYHVWPSEEWPEGARVKERLRLYVPRDCAPGNYRLYLRFYDTSSGLHIPLGMHPGGGGAEQLLIGSLSVTGEDAP